VGSLLFYFRFITNPRKFSTFLQSWRSFRPQPQSTNQISIKSQSIEEGLFTLHGRVALRGSCKQAWLF
jgi:hypothetical protein